MDFLFFDSASISAVFCFFTENFIKFIAWSTLVFFNLHRLICESSMILKSVNLRGK